MKGDRWNMEQVKGSARRIWRGALAGVAACLLVVCACMLAGCGDVKVDDTSPQVKDVHLSAQSDMSESSQHIDITLEFDRPISASGDVMGDFSFQLNGADVDAKAIFVEALPSADAVTVSLRPASDAQGPGAGAYFATYQSAFSLSAKAADGALPSITGSSGAAAVLAQPVTGVLPSGAAMEVTSSQEGSTEANTPAKVTFAVTSPATVRAITWFSPDGGATKLLKHNHAFASADADDFAADLAEVVNAASGLGVRATAKGTEVTLVATSVTDGQKLEPVIVEGVGATPGAYDGSAAGGGA